MSNIDSEIQRLFKDDTVKDADILEIVKTRYLNDVLSNTTLGLLFEAYVRVQGWEDEEKYISQPVTMDELVMINKSFKTTNGNQWARTNQNYLGKKYNIERELIKGSVGIIKLNGLNINIQKYRTIRSDIVKEISGRRCVILDIGTNIEVDHKNGRYDSETVANLETQSINDFQPLCKTANDAKRHHCKVCIESNKRYNAQNLGYKEGWTEGSELTDNCIGCYWYDPYNFNEVISKDFKKQDTD